MGRRAIVFAFLLIVAVSAILGIPVGRMIGPRVSRLVLVCGLGTLATALAVIGTAMRGLSPFDTITSGLIAVILLGAAAVLLPFGVVAACCRR